MRRFIRLQFIVLFFMIAFYSVYAFASSGTSGPGAGGEGASPISGWTVSNVDYHLGQDSSNITAVEFDLDGAAKTVQVRLNSSTGEFFTCENLHGMHWYCNTGSQVSLAGADEFRVIAMGQ